jgi:hypothetical protein
MEHFFHLFPDDVFPEVVPVMPKEPMRVSISVAMFLFAQSPSRVLIIPLLQIELLCRVYVFVGLADSSVFIINCRPYTHYDSSRDSSRAKYVESGEEKGKKRGQSAPG